MHNKMALMTALDREIDLLIESEAKRVTRRGQEELHVLLENREHVQELIDAHEGVGATAVPTATTPKF